MPSSQRNCCRTFPLDLGVLSGGKWGQEQSGRSPQGQRLGFPEEEGAHLLVLRVTQWSGQ